MSIQYSPKIVTDGLVLYFDAKNSKSAVSGSGIWKDMITGNQAVLTNTPIYNNQGYYTFDSASLQYGTFTSIRSQLTGDRSLSAWVYSTVADERQFIYSDWFLTDGISVGWRESNQVTFGYGEPGGVAQWFGSATELQTNVWYNFTGVYDGVIGSEKVYINGNKETTAEIVGISTSDGQIGRRQTGVNYWNGHIAVIQVYNKALSVAEVTQNYNALKGRFL